MSTRRGRLAAERAARNACQSCKRKGALSTVINPGTASRVCRYCGWESTTTLAPFEPPPSSDTPAPSPEVERIADLLDAHLAGDYTHLFYDDPAAIDPPVDCRCGWRRTGRHATHVAAVVVAALAQSPP